MVRPEVHPAIRTALVWARSVERQLRRKGVATGGTGERLVRVRISPNGTEDEVCVLVEWPAAAPACYVARLSDFESAVPVALEAYLIACGLGRGTATDTVKALGREGMEADEPPPIPRGIRHGEPACPDDPDRTFLCRGCDRLTCWCAGHGGCDLCDDCCTGRCAS